MTTAERTLAAALARHGLDLRGMRALRGDGQAPAFRLRLARGAAAKLRLYPSSAASARVDACLRAARPGLLPRPIACLGRRLIVEFIEGATLDQRVSAGAPAESVRWAAAAGRLLARLHASPVPPHAFSPPAIFAARSERGLRQLVRRRLLEPGEAERLLAAAAPRSAPRAITHGDLCPENLVVDRRGRLRAIDEERVAVRPAPYDLARSICRWSASADVEDAILRGYRAGGGHTAAFDEYRVFWLTSALTTSTSYRLRRTPGRVGPAVAMLRRLSRVREAGNPAGHSPVVRHASRALPPPQRPAT